MELKHKTDEQINPVNGLQPSTHTIVHLSNASPALFDVCLGNCATGEIRFSPPPLTDSKARFLEMNFVLFCRTLVVLNEYVEMYNVLPFSLS